MLNNDSTVHFIRVEDPEGSVHRRYIKAANVHRKTNRLPTNLLPHSFFSFSSATTLTHIRIAHIAASIDTIQLYFYLPKQPDVILRFVREWCWACTQSRHKHGSTI